MNAKQKIDNYVMQTYGRFPVCFTQGNGCILKDDTGKEYIDFLAGIAVCNLGHAHPAIAKAVCDQARQAAARQQPVLHRAPGQGGRAVGGEFVRRPGVFLQLRGRGQRGSPEAGQAVGQVHGQGPLHRGHGQEFLSRPDHGHAFGHGSGKNPKRASIPWFRPSST